MFAVELEFKRVQTFLFTVPRLKAMIGANALLGETMRGEWTGETFADSGEQEKARSLPALAVQCGSAWPDGFEINLSALQQGEAADPLKIKNCWQDNSALVAKKTGILVRDGGHFHALFPTEKQACVFIKRAQELLAEQLPNVPFAARLKELIGENAKELNSTLPLKTNCSVFDLPPALICQWSGAEPASEKKKYAEETEEEPVSQLVGKFMKKAESFNKGETHDVLGILRDELLSATGFPEKKDFPTEMSQVATEGYVAVLHIDGNSVGKRLQSQKPVENRSYLENWLRSETFFHLLRRGMRQAVVKAMKHVFHREKTGLEIPPVRLLMLGGDDLLLVCGAPFAIPFAIELAQAVKAETAELPGEGGVSSLTLGIGIAILKASFPFHRAHDLAEQLAASAKRLKAAQPQESLVDWVVSTESWHGDIGETRRRHALVDIRLLLTRKPYCVAKDKQPELSLEKLWDDAQALYWESEKGSVARSQLQKMADSLSEGENSARFAAFSLPQPARKFLTERGYLDKDESPWRTASENSKILTTGIHDLIELYELARLHPCLPKQPDSNDVNQNNSSATMEAAS